MLELFIFLLNYSWTWENRVFGLMKFIIMKLLVATLEMPRLELVNGTPQWNQLFSESYAELHHLDKISISKHSCLDRHINLTDCFWWVNGKCKGSFSLMFLPVIASPRRPRNDWMYSWESRTSPDPCPWILEVQRVPNEQGHQGQICTPMSLQVLSFRIVIYTFWIPYSVVWER